MSTPSTEPAREFLRVQERYNLWLPIDGRRDDAVAAILAIEAEARQAVLEELAREVEGLPKWDKRSVPGGFHVNRAAVLALLASPSPEKEKP